MPRGGHVARTSGVARSTRQTATPPDPASCPRAVAAVPSARCLLAARESLVALPRAAASPPPRRREREGGAMAPQSHRP
eukprot:3013332-Prymnesium_polylepis.1